MGSFADSMLIGVQLPCRIGLKDFYDGARGG